MLGEVKNSSFIAYFLGICQKLLNYERLSTFFGHSVHFVSTS